jgi:hypothetical protein
MLLHPPLFVLCACLSIGIIRLNRALAAERPLADWVKDPDSDQPLVREEAIEMIASFGAGARSAAPRSRVLLKDDRPPVRARAAIASWTA